MYQMMPGELNFFEGDEMRGMKNEHHFLPGFAGGIVAILLFVTIRCPPHPQTLTPSHPHNRTPAQPHTLTPSHPHTLTPSHPPFPPPPHTPSHHHTIMYHPRFPAKRRQRKKCAGLFPESQGQNLANARIWP